MENPIISVKNLDKSFRVRQEKNLLKGLFKPNYKDHYAVRDLTFSVAKGESVAFLGPNGAGKTTTTKMLTGLIYPTAGQIKVFGYTPFERNRDFLRRIGLVMGNKAGLNWDLTARQSFRLLKGIYGMEEKTFEKRLVELTNLLDTTQHLDTQIRRLSLGERMKMELIGAILHNPEVLFLDEPTIGLDIITRKNVRAFLRTIQRELGTTLILTSHDMDDVEHVCDRVIVINHGRLMYDDSLQSLTTRYKQDRFVRLVFEEAPDETSMQTFGKVLEKENGSYLLRAHRTELAPLLSWAAAQENLLDIQVESVPLENIIAELFQHRS